MAQGTLYIVSTPIGNLKDITLRALDILREADFIAAEDTRHTQKLLNHYEIKARTLSFHEYSDEKKLEQLLALLSDGARVALCSDAGTPLISDPGYILVKRCVERDIAVECLPGPCAAIAAATLSGIDLREFLFAGFLPPKAAARQKELARLRDTGVPIVLYESPNRIVAALEDICAVFGEDAPVSISRELTKLYEETVRESAGEAHKIFSARDKIKGEFVVVVGKAQAAGATEEEILGALRARVSSGMAKKQAVTEVTALFSCPRNKVYRLALTL
ncbi:MAG TPA: 16S rRNA (cytidine(1402)-2'-O)-methyltransferase [Clostridiales bacterium]|nr:16S rRNA (cytidine(1402)-2'-O)-methyltransferase [Clostridiales bacterium]